MKYKVKKTKILEEMDGFAGGSSSGGGAVSGTSSSVGGTGSGEAIAAFSRKTKTSKNKKVV